VPSLTGKTLGTNNNSYIKPQFWVSAGSNFNSRTGSLGIQSNTFDIWGVQIEQGSTATAFQTATGTIQGELAACQRYYYRANANGSAYGNTATGAANSATAFWGDSTFPVTMRTAPSTLDTSSVGNYRVFNYADTVSGTPSAITIDTNITTANIARIIVTTSGLTANQPMYLRGNNTASSFLGFSAEL
jgi:hypothetical protein